MDLGIGPAGVMIMQLGCQPPQTYARGTLWPSNQNFCDFRHNRPFERKDYPNNDQNRYSDYNSRSQYEPDGDQSRNRESNNNFSRSPSMSRQDSSFTDFRRRPRSNSPNRSVFNRFGNRDPSNNISYDKKFPISSNGDQPNVVRFTTTDDSIDELSGLCSLNY